MRLIVEALLDEGKPVTLIDPKGDWWGIKSSATGKQAGYPVVIFGGEHADVPLNPHAGGQVAELVSTGNRPCLIDLGGWMVGERTRFFIDFASSLFRHTRGARYLVIDEVHNFAPQGKVLDVDAGKCLHWANRLASEGRGKGITIIAASQRPQKVHKDFLTSCETLIAGRVIHKLDRDAIKDWIDGCADPEKGKQVLAELAGMQRSEAWVWSPEINFGPKKIEFPMFNTYDSFKPQEHRAGPLKGWAEVDLDEVREKLTSVIEEAKANDPAELRKQVAVLKRQVDSGPTPAWRAEYEGAHARDTESAYNRGVAAGQKAQGPLRKALEEAVKFIVEINAKGFSKESKQAVRKGEIEKAMADAAKSVEASIERHMGKRAQELESLARQSQQLIKRLTALLEDDVKIKIDVKHNQPFTVSPSNIAKADAAWDRHMTNGGLPPGEHATLKAALQYPGLDRKRLTVLTGYKRSSRDAYIARLVQKGFVETRGQELHPTQAGAAAIGNFEPLPTGEALIEYWKTRLPEGERKTLEVLIEARGEDVDREKIDDQTGYKRSSRDAYLMRLKARGLVEFSGRGMVRASAELF